jgi:hypothetical protein
MQLSLQLSKLQGTTSYFDGNMGRVGVKSDTVILCGHGLSGNGRGGFRHVSNFFISTGIRDFVLNTLFQALYLEIKPLKSTLAA